MNLSLIVAASENNCIGVSGDLPWRLSADLKKFKKLTMGHSIIMGRKTFESIGRLLPGRTTVIVTRQDDYRFEGALIAKSLEHALDLVGEDERPFITGGAEIYRLALPIARSIFLTRVKTHIEGDTFFPSIEWDKWKLEDSEAHESDGRNEFDYVFESYVRNSDVANDG